MEDFVSTRAMFYNHVVLIDQLILFCFDDYVNLEYVFGLCLRLYMMSV